MQDIVSYLNKNYTPQNITLSFTFKDIDLDCHIIFTDQEAILKHGVANKYDAKLVCKFSDWLKLASDRLNPIWGIISGRLKFYGDAKLFRALNHAPSIVAPIDTKKEKTITTPPQTITVLTASPRKGNGYTALLTKSLVKGLSSVAGKEIKTLDLADFSITRCTGCWHCWQKNDGECIFKDIDDHYRLNSILDNSDMIIFAFPLYADGMPSKLKDYFERHVSSLHPYIMQGEYNTCHLLRRNKKNQSLALLSICGFPDEQHFDAVRSHFRPLAPNAPLLVAAELVRPAIMYLINNPTLLDLQKSILNDIYEAGRELASYGMVNKTLSDRISAPICTIDEFIKYANIYWQERIDNRDGIDY